MTAVLLGINALAEHGKPAALSADGVNHR